MNRRMYGQRISLVVGAGLLWMLFSSIGVVDAKDCGPGVNFCSCGDTVVTDYNFGGAYQIGCYGVDQALKVAPYVTLDCADSTIYGNGVNQSAGFRLGEGSSLYNCWSTGFQYHVKFDGNNPLMYGGGGWDSTDECFHLSTGTGGSRLYYVWGRAPLECLYVLQSYSNSIYGSYLQGNNGTYLKQGSSGTWIQACTLAGGPNRVNFDGAGNGNVLDQNDYQGGTVRSSGSAYPNYVGPSGYYPGSLNNQDGSLVLY
jgi:hypothetical protein